MGSNNKSWLISTTDLSGFVTFHCRLVGPSKQKGQDTETISVCASRSSDAKQEIYACLNQSSSLCWRASTHQQGINSNELTTFIKSNHIPGFRGPRESGLKYDPKENVGGTKWIGHSVCPHSFQTSHVFHMYYTFQHSSCGQDPNHRTFAGFCYYSYKQLRQLWLQQGNLRDVCHC